MHLMNTLRQFDVVGNFPLRYAVYNLILYPLSSPLYFHLVTNLVTGCPPFLTFCQSIGLVVDFMLKVQTWRLGVLHS